MDGFDPSVMALVAGFPAFLGVVMGLLANLERWMLAPDEHAAAVVVLLDGEHDAEEVEEAVSRRLAAVVDGYRARPAAG